MVKLVTGLAFTSVDGRSDWMILLDRDRAMNKPLNEMTYDELDEYIQKTQMGNWITILLMACRNINYTNNSGTASAPTEQRQK